MKKLKIVLLLALVILLGVSCYLLMNSEPSGNTVVSGEEEQLFTVKTVTEDITEISLINPEGVFGFEKKDGEWYNIFTTSVKTEGNAIYAIESILKQTYAVDEIELNVASMAKYGLDKPSVTARYKTANSEGFIKIGSSVVGTKYYFTTDDVNVYTMDSMDAGMFFTGMRGFFNMVLIDTDISAIQSVTLTTFGETIKIERKTEDEIAKGGAGGLFSYALRSPVKENVSPNEIQMFFEKIASTSAVGYDPYIGDDEAGFSESERFFECVANNKKLGFTIGKKLSNGRVYVKKSGVKGAYTIASEELDFMDYTAFKLVDKHITLYYYDEVESITITNGSDSYNITLGENPEVNGKSLAKEEAQEFFKNLISLTYDDSLTKEIENPVADVTVSFVRSSGKDVTHYVSADAMNYAVKRNGAMEFTIQKKYVEKILSLVKEL